MHRTIILTGMFVVAFASGSSFADSAVYRANEGGEIIYSDQAYKNSEKLKLPAVNTHEAPKVQIPTSGPSDPTAPEALRYQVQIVTPENAATVISAVGEVTMDFNTQPSLLTHAGHRLRWSLGKLSGETSGLNVRVVSVDRGTHTLSVSVVDAEGLALSDTSHHVFHLLRPSVNIQENLKKSNQQAPRAP